MSPRKAAFSSDCNNMASVGLWKRSRITGTGSGVGYGVVLPKYDSGPDRNSSLAWDFALFSQKQGRARFVYELGFIFA